MDGSGIGEALVRGIIAISVIAFGLGALLMWGVPKLWDILKPAIHAATS